MKFKYSSTGQFRNAIRTLKSKQDLKKVDYIGTVKVHGTNGNIIYDVNTKKIQIFSKNNELNHENTNYDFYYFIKDRETIILKLFEQLRENINTKYGHLKFDKIVISGEYAGKNIFKNTAVSQVDKFFYIFGFCVIDSTNIIKENGIESYFKYHLAGQFFANIDSEKNRIYNAYNIKQYSITIDLNEPQKQQNNLIDVTNEVEKVCPVGKYLGVLGIGEGVVYKPVDPLYQNSEFWFKVKGEKHSSSKVKKLAEVDVEKLSKINDFIEYACTENRMQQGVYETGKASYENISNFLRWLINDIYKEEGDTIEENKFSRKEINPEISKKARSYYINLIESDL